MKKTIDVKVLPDDFLLEEWTLEGIAAVFQKAQEENPDLTDFHIYSRMVAPHAFGDDHVLQSVVYGRREETDAEREAREIFEEQRRVEMAAFEATYAKQRAERIAAEVQKERAEYERLKQKFGY